MTREEHLLVIIAEECSEIAKNATKALRFGLDDHEPGQSEANATRMLVELNDLLAVFVLLKEDNAEFAAEYERIKQLQDTLRENKIYKVEKFLTYSAERGRLTK